LTKGLQCRLGDDGVTDDAVERRAVAPCTSDPGRGPRRRWWRSFPPLQCSLGSVRVCGVGCVRRCGEPHTASRGPHPLFIALCDGGPPTMDWLGGPDQGARTSPLRPLGCNGREIELTPTTLFFFSGPEDLCSAVSSAGYSSKFPHATLNCCSIAVAGT
jgi:hypothetical protein